MSERPGFFQLLRDVVVGGRMIKNAAPAMLGILNDPRSRQEVIRQASRFSAVIGTEKVIVFLQELMESLKNGEGRSDNQG